MKSYKSILTLVLLCVLFSFKSEDKGKEFLQSDDIKIQLVGQWEFVKLIDDNDNKIDTIWEEGYDNRIELVNRASLNLKEDGHYFNTYTPTKTDSGLWDYNATSNTIVYFLLIDANSFAGEYLINKGYAEKHTDGKYYQKMEEKIISINEKELMIFEKPNYRKVYRRKK